MAKRRRGSAPDGWRALARRAGALRPDDPGAAIALAALAVAVVGSALVVDPRAASAFDAPKRLITLGGIVVAAVGLLAFPGRGGPIGRFWPEGLPVRRAPVLLLLLAAAGAAVAAAVSPRRGVSLDALRVLLVHAVLLPLGASRALDGARARGLLAAFLAACAVNATVSLLQSRQLVQPFQAETLGGRTDTGAFAGNEGVLALALALAAVAALALALSAGRPVLRLAAGSGALLFLAGIAVNRSLTAGMVLLVGALVLLGVRFRRRLLLPAALAILVAGAGIAAYAPFRDRAAELVRDIRAGAWDRAVTYRLGPWAAAIEMARARPLIGWGPGTFAAEFVPHRLQAEIRFRTRFVNPWLAGSYAEAHSEYLQVLAETGIPTGIVAMAAAGALLAGLLPVARDSTHPAREEALLLLAVLSVGAAAALTWFPLQRPISAVPLLLAAGRAWRISHAGVRGPGR
jgi:O-antigen ligase